MILSDDRSETAQQILFFIVMGTRKVRWKKDGERSEERDNNTLTTYYNGVLAEIYYLGGDEICTKRLLCARITHEGTKEEKNHNTACFSQIDMLVAHH